MPNPIFVQLSEAEATTQKEAQNSAIETGGQGATLIAVQGQVSNYFSCIIPLARQVEFNASDAVKQTNFANFSAVAQSSQYSGTDFVTAWETEYAKIYG